MKQGHEFPAEHGFTGSAHVTKEMRPSVPGFTRGTNLHTSSADPEEADGVSNMKHGGLAHVKSHHKNYAHGGKVEHDNHSHTSKVSYDKHGFEMHKE